MIPNRSRRIKEMKMFGIHEEEYNIDTTNKCTIGKTETSSSRKQHNE